MRQVTQKANTSYRGITRVSAKGNGKYLPSPVKIAIRVCLLALFFDLLA